LPGIRIVGFESVVALWQKFSKVLGLGPEVEEAHPLVSGLRRR
jgi:hypothetical protein